MMLRPISVYQMCGTLMEGAQEALPPAEKAMRLDPAAEDFYAGAAGTALLYWGATKREFGFSKGTWLPTPTI